jgi:hypothetical protein
MDTENDESDDVDEDILEEILQDPAQLAIATIKIWARLFTRNIQWPFINVIGQSLSLYAQLLEGKL